MGANQQVEIVELSHGKIWIDEQGESGIFERNNRNVCLIESVQDSAPLGD